MLNFDWARSIGGASMDAGNSIIIDGSGLIYVTGYFQGTVDFDPGTATFNLTSNGGEDVFIQKSDASGNLIWARSMGGPSNEVGKCIAADASGNSYVTGYYEGTADFDPGVATFNLTSNGGEDVFIQKLDASGNFIWAISIGGTSDENGRSITTDTLGNVYVIGYYRDMVDFDPGAASFNLTSNGGDDIFIVKLDSNGNFIWAVSMGGILPDRGFSITSDALGNLYATGKFSSTVDFDPGSTTFSLTANGGEDVFIQKLDNQGNFIWAKSMGGAANDEGRSVINDNSGNVYVAGNFEGITDINPGPDTFNLISNGSWDIFIQKLDDFGNFIWAKSMGGTIRDGANNITTDALGNVYVSGKFQDTVDFDPNAATLDLVSNGDYDVFIQKLDANGNLKWARSLGGPSYDQGESIITDISGNVYVTGYYQGTVDFDPSAATSLLTSNGNEDVFIQKFNQSTVGQEERILFNPVSVFPNPNTGIFKINGSENGILTVKVFNLQGKLLKSFENNIDNEFNLSDFRQGMYLIYILKDEQLIQIKKIIIY